MDVVVFHSHRDGALHAHSQQAIFSSYDYCAVHGQLSSLVAISSLRASASMKRRRQEGFRVHISTAHIGQSEPRLSNDATFRPLSLLQGGLGLSNHSGSGILQGQRHEPRAQRKSRGVN